ncbi:hypothetical protein NL676_004326 [Syzygium grande]|nr:hypothetical protein NL676_004326 [Syzygium grande]
MMKPWTLGLAPRQREANPEAKLHCSSGTLSPVWILALLNDIPASSRKYQFAMSMADRILEENARDGHEDLLEINRMALAPAFLCTSSLLYRSLQQTQSKDNDSGVFPMSIIRALPMGSYINSYLKGFNVCVGAVVRYMKNGTLPWHGGWQLRGAAGMDEGEMVQEKLAQELLCVRICCIVL